MAIKVHHSSSLLLLLPRKQLLVTLAASLCPRYCHATLLHPRNSLVQVKVVGGQNVVALFLNLNLK